jgi:hypothetical protein
LDRRPANEDSRRLLDDDFQDFLQAATSAESVFHLAEQLEAVTTPSQPTGCRQAD